MTRVVLVMHEPLGSALADCARHILGHEPDLDVIDFKGSDAPEMRVQEIVSVLTRSPVAASLVLCDIFGATPFNTARKAAQQARSGGFEVEILTGANLSMLLKALTASQHDFPEYLCAVRAAASRGIVCAGDPS